MSFTTEDPIKHYTGDGSNDQFSFPYLFYTNSAVAVVKLDSAGVVTGEVLDTDYTIIGALDPAGGIVTYPKAGGTKLAANEQIAIFLDPARSQPTDIKNKDSHFLYPTETRLDIITQLVQRLFLSEERSLRGPMTDLDTVNMIFPGAAARANLAAIFDENGAADVGGAIAVPEASVANINAGVANKYMPPDNFAGSIFGRPEASVPVFASDASVATGDGTLMITAGDKLNGMEWKNFYAIVSTKGITGTTDIQIRRRRAGVEVDVLSTKITIGDEFNAEDGIINAANADIVKGDIFFIDVDAVHSGTAPLGLSVMPTAGLP